MAPFQIDLGGMTHLLAVKTAASDIVEDPIINLGAAARYGFKVSFRLCII
jgi:hypothetical protein